MTSRGGRIPPDGRQPAAKGVGRESRRHDLERPATPGLHGSDLQQGEVSELERGRRIAPIRQQDRGRNPNPPSRRREQGQQTAGGQGGGLNIPDAIDFMASRSSGAPAPPIATTGVTGGKLELWGPLLERMVTGPGSSGLLAQAYIRQLRRLKQTRINRPAVTLNLNDVDDGLEAMNRELEVE